MRRRVLGATISGVSLPVSWMLRLLCDRSPAVALVGETVEGVHRRGKHVVFTFGASSLVVNPMLVGRFSYVSSDGPSPRHVVMTLELATGFVLHYMDAKQMGRLYLVAGTEFSRIPGFLEQGPEPLDPAFTYERFLERLKGRYGEVKTLLTNAKVVAGIGNAYADEILFEAGIYPFRRKRDLSADELRRVYEAIGPVLRRAKTVVAERMGDEIDRKIRDFLNVHGKGDQPCPRCGQRIATVGRREHGTNFCRRCQPGLMTSPGRGLRSVPPEITPPG